MDPSEQQNWPVLAALCGGVKVVGTPVAYHNSDYGCRIPGSVIGSDPHLPPDPYPIPSLMYVLGGQFNPSGQFWSHPPSPVQPLAFPRPASPSLSFNLSVSSPSATMSWDLAGHLQGWGCPHRCTCLCECLSLPVSLSLFSLPPLSLTDPECHVRPHVRAARPARGP